MVLLHGSFGAAYLNGCLGILRVSLFWLFGMEGGNPELNLFPHSGTVWGAILMAVSCFLFCCGLIVENSKCYCLSRPCKPSTAV